MPHGLRLTIAYDGTHFHGFQSQAGLRCVQSELALAIAQVSQAAPEEVEVRGASRTDAGVHARGQVVAFDTERELTPRRWVQALNRYLPPDLAVQNAEPCPLGFQPRFAARDKIYRYVFHVGPVRDPLATYRAWHLGRHIPWQFADRNLVDGAVHGLDLNAMHETTAVLTGTHDFCAFRAAADTREVTVRTMLQVKLLERHLDDPHLLALQVHGTAFMKNMVRIMAGTVIAAGRGRLTPEAVGNLLRPGLQRQDNPGNTAPPEGLTLLQVRLAQDTARPAAPKPAGSARPHRP